MARKKKESIGTLTKAEEQVMQAVWQLGKGFAGEIAEAVEEPKPAYRTVLTEIRILEQKGFVAHREMGGNNQYYPLVSKADYSGRQLSTLMRNYFGSSYRQLVSFFMEDKNLRQEDLDALSLIIEEKRKEVRK
ncbi:MAG: BlaI/MecI/CopY family transcriptional regulator [Bacteroidales bacterium]|nr:BlaI/MecI/CopY family transcriptional regulator [Bacteroidales bacterium]